MQFIVDFDGTLSTADTTDKLLSQFAAPIWQAIEQQWVDGSINAMECMSRQIRLVEGDRVSLSAFFRSIELDLSFLPFYRYVEAFSEIAIVSDGLDHAIMTAFRLAGFPEIPVFANRLHFVPGGLDITFPYSDASCAVGSGVCKCAVAQRLTRMAGGPLVLIGDGKSDACLASRADVVFAKGALIEYCDVQRIEYHPFETFADLLLEVKAWPNAIKKRGLA